jgi:hypothetical protein
MDDIEQSNQVTIRELQSVRLPLTALRAALSCAADEQSRFYLNGVYVHATGGEYRVVGTDGHRMLVHSTPIPAKLDGDNLPAWLAKGVIVPREGLKERLTLLDKVAGSTVDLAYQVDAPQLVLSDLPQSCIFRMRPVDGTYSDYQQVLDGLKVFEARQSEEMASVAYDSGYLKGVGELAKLLGSKTVRVFGSTGSDDEHNDPSLVTFPDCPEAILLLMPQRRVEARLGFGAARVLTSAVAGTVAALRAHRTRWANVLDDTTSTKKAKADATAKIADYDRRIAEVITNAAEPALPPPPDPREVFMDAVQLLLDAREGDQLPEEAGEIIYWCFDEGMSPEQTVEKLFEPEPPSYAIADAVEPVKEPTIGETIAAYRAKLRGKGRERAERQFRADINAELSADHGGLTVGQLADGVPIDDWFTTGLSPAEAATRCLDWRRIAAVLPADEVLPGEADLPAGLLTSPARDEIAGESEPADGDEPARAAE